MFKDSNGAFKGIVRDLTDALERYLRLNITLRLSKDGMYGRPTRGGWTGMVGELMRGVSDEKQLYKIKK